MLIVLPAAYQGAVPNVPIDILKAFENSSFYVHFGAHVSQGAIDSYFGFMVCSSGIACVLSSFTIPALSRRFGRRKVVFVVGGLSLVIGSVLELVAYYVTSFELFILGQMFGAGFGWSFGYALQALFEVTAPLTVLSDVV